MAGVNSEDEFYNMFPTEESFFQAYPEARTYANGGATYPYPGQATADQFFNYGMQGKGAGAQIPVETWFAYGGFTSKPSATLVHYEDGGMGQHSSPFNYGAFPAFAKKGNQVQGGGIDAATGTIKDNFLAAIQKNNQLALNKQAAEQAMEIAPQVMPELLYPAFQNGGSNLNAFTSAYEDIRQDRANKMGDFMGSVAGAVSYETDKRIKQNMYDEFNKKLNELMAKQKQFDPMKDAQTTPEFNPVPENMAKLGGSLKKFQGNVDGSQTGNTPSSSNIEINKEKYKYYQQRKAAYDKRKEDRAKGNADLVAATTELNKLKEQYNNEYAAAKTDADKIAIDTKYQFQFKNAESKVQAANNLITLSNNVSNYAVLEADPGKAVYSVKAIQWMDRNPIEPFTYQEGKPNVNIPKSRDLSSPRIALTEDQEFDKDIEEPVTPEKLQKTTAEPEKATTPKVETQGSAPAITGTKPGQRYVPGTTPVTSTTPKTTTGTAPKTTGTPATTEGGDPVEAAVKQLATAYGVDPDQTWQNYQSIMSSYGTRGAGTGYPSYFTTGDDYRYRGRGKGSPFVRDIGYMPTPQDIQAMQAQASQMGYGLKVTEKPRFLGFGPKKIIIETTFNPNTGKVEETPKVVDETPAPAAPVSPIIDYKGIPINEPVTVPEGWVTDTPVESNVPTQPVTSPVTGGNYDFVQISGSNPPMSKEEFMKGKIQQDLSEQKYGGLMRFLPKHDMLGQTGGYEGKPVNSIFDTLSDIQDSDMTGTAGIPGVTGKKTGSKGVYKQKIQTPPWMADTMLTGISALSSMASGDEEERARQEMTQRMRGDYVFGTSGGKDVGTYVPTGALTGVLSPNLYNPAVDTGYMGGFKKDRGGSVAYSDWSQTPVNGYYGVPQGEFSPYSSWSQSPVRMQSGGAMMQDGVYDLSEDEINAIIQAGGQVEFLD